MHKPLLRLSPQFARSLLRGIRFSQSRRGNCSFASTAFVTGCSGHCGRILISYIGKVLDIFNLFFCAFFAVLKERTA